MFVQLVAGFGQSKIQWIREICLSTDSVLFRGNLWMIQRQAVMKKKRSERRKHYALAVERWSQKFSLHYRPPFRSAGWPKCNQQETVTTFTYRPSLVKIDACNFELLW